MRFDYEIQGIMAEMEELRQEIESIKIWHRGANKKDYIIINAWHRPACQMCTKVSEALMNFIRENEEQIKENENLRIEGCCKTGKIEINKA